MAIPATYRWEIVNGALTSVEKNGATKNDPLLISGSIEDGMLKNAVYSLSKGVNLDCNKPWVVEWKTFDNPGVFWTGCIMAEAQRQQDGRFVLQSKTESHFNLVIGEYAPDNPNNNNGYMYCTIRLIKDGIGTSTADAHTYRLENRIYEDGSHKVFLRVDGAEIGALVISANWVNEAGADMVFNYIGTTNNTVRDLKLDYLQVWENINETDDKNGATPGRKHLLYQMFPPIIARALAGSGNGGDNNPTVATLDGDILYIENSSAVLINDTLEVQ